MRSLAFALTLLWPVMSLFAEIKMQTVEYQDGDVACKGVLVWDQGPEGGKAAPKPGVLIIPEWWGINDYMKTRAKQVAELGYVAFIADMYGDAKVTADPKQATEWSKLRNDRPKFRARAMAGLEAFRKNATGLDSTRIAAIGYCFGGTGVLEMARGGADLKGVVSFHGGLEMPEPAPAAIKAKILICHGADDPMVPPQQLHDLVEDLKKAKANYQVNIYSGAVHAFTNPDADKMGIDGIGYNKQADTRSWEAMKNFLAEVFAG